MGIFISSQMIPVRGQRSGTAGVNGWEREKVLRGYRIMWTDFSYIYAPNFC